MSNNSSANEATASVNTAGSDQEMIVTKYVYRYHNDSLRKLNFVLLGFAFLLGLLWLFVFVQIGTEPKPLHFKLNENLEMIEPVPLDQEGITNAALLNWINEIVMDAFSFNYSNVARQQSRLSPYFADAAMKLYIDMLTTDEDFSNIGKNKFVVSVIPKQAPDIVVGQAYQGHYAWQVQAPIIVTFGNALYTSSQEMLINFLVLRVPTTDSPLGVTVATFTRQVVGRIAPRSLRSGF